MQMDLRSSLVSLFTDVPLLNMCSLIISLAPPELTAPSYPTFTLFDDGRQQLVLIVRMVRSHNLYLSRLPIRSMHHVPSSHLKAFARDMAAARTPDSRMHGAHRGGEQGFTMLASIDVQVDVGHEIVKLKQSQQAYHLFARSLCTAQICQSSLPHWRPIFQQRAHTKQLVLGE